MPDTHSTVVERVHLKGKTQGRHSHCTVPAYGVHKCISATLAQLEAEAKPKLCLPAHAHPHALSLCPYFFP